MPFDQNSGEFVSVGPPTLVCHDNAIVAMLWSARLCCFAWPLRCYGLARGGNYHSLTYFQVAFPEARERLQKAGCVSLTPDSELPSSQGSGADFQEDEANSQEQVDPMERTPKKLKLQDGSAISIPSGSSANEPLSKS